MIVDVLYLHIVFGTIGLVCGFIAALSKKGRLTHRVGGIGFLCFMGISLLLGVAEAIQKPERITVIAGTYSLYLMLTGWLAVKEFKVGSSYIEFGLTAVGALIFASSIFFGIKAITSEDGLTDGFPAGPYFFFGALALISTIADIRRKAKDKLVRRKKLTRHLGRMCGAMLIVEASIFLGQSDVFPAQLQRMGLLLSPLILIALVMVGWVWRLRKQSDLKR